MQNFYPRPPCGGRLITPTAGSTTLRISIHVPLAGDDSKGRRNAAALFGFLSTSPLRGTTAADILRAIRRDISIHVPLAGDDPGCRADGAAAGISIHVPLAGDDLAAALKRMPALSFLSTSPLRGTTANKLLPRVNRLFLSTSPLRGTTTGTRTGVAGCPFLSTSPLRGTTWRG